MQVSGESPDAYIDLIQAPGFNVGAWNHPIQGLDLETAQNSKLRGAIPGATELHFVHGLKRWKACQV